MGEIVKIASQEAAEQAWADYRAYAARAIANPKLLLDLSFMQEKRRLERKWERLFDRIDG